MMFFPVPINDCYSCGQKYIGSTCPHCEITRLRAQLAAAEADRLAAMERVRDAAIKRVELLLLGRSRVVGQQITKAILAIDLDALAEGEK